PAAGAARWRARPVARGLSARSSARRARRHRGRLRRPRLLRLVPPRQSRVGTGLLEALRHRARRLRVAAANAEGERSLLFQGHRDEWTWPRLKQRRSLVAIHSGVRRMTLLYCLSSPLSFQRSFPDRRPPPTPERAAAEDLVRERPHVKRNPLRRPRARCDPA